MSGFMKSLFGKTETMPETAGVAVAEVEMVASMAEPVHVSDETFEKVVLEAEVPAVVDFWAPWCGPCRMVAPIIEDLAKDYDGRAVIAKINTDEHVKVASQLGIMGIPTLVIFKNGQEVDRVVGYQPRGVLEEKLKAQLD